jgi:hypothetical protein
MKRLNSLYTNSLIGGFILCLALSACNLKPGENTPRQALFIGIDASGSFLRSGHYEDSLAFLAHYLYGHINEFDGLTKPRAVFVGSIGGTKRG